MLGVNGGGSGCSCYESHYLLETGLKGLSPGQRAPERGTVFQVWAKPSCTVSTCCVGHTTRTCRSRGAAQLPKTISGSEPSKLQPLSHPSAQRLLSWVRPVSQSPEDRGCLHLLVGTTVERRACLPDTGWGQGVVRRSLLRSRGYRWASPQACSPSSPPDPRISEQRLWVSVLPEPRPKPAQGWGGVRLQVRM